MKQNIVVIYGSVRKSRQGIKAARFIVNKLKQRGHDAVLVDPVAYRLPLLDKMYKEYGEGESPLVMEKLGKLLDRADGFVIVSGEYNHGIPPALKNLLDHYKEEYHFKPAAIVSYSAGPFGGVRMAVHLRAVLGELGMVTIPSMFPISGIQNSFDDKGNAVVEDYNRMVKKFINEFEWYLAALTSARKNGKPY